MFIDKLNKICDEKGISVNKIAIAIGLSDAAPTKWRNGSEPRLSTIKKIANKLDVPVSYFYDESNENKKTAENGGSVSEKREMLIKIVKGMDEKQVDAFLHLIGKDD